MAKIFLGLVTGKGDEAFPQRLADSMIQGVPVERVLVEDSTSETRRVIVIVEKHGSRAMLGRYQLQVAPPVFLVLGELVPLVVVDDEIPWLEFRTPPQSLQPSTPPKRKTLKSKS